MTPAEKFADWQRREYGIGGNEQPDRRERMHDRLHRAAMALRQADHALIQVMEVGAWMRKEIKKLG